MKVVISLWNDSPHCIEVWHPDVWLGSRSYILEIPDTLANELFRKQDEMYAFQDALSDLARSCMYDRSL